MDSYQQQPHGGYMRPPQPPPPPPPPHTADPHQHQPQHHQYHQIPPLPPPQGPWFTPQFQYQTPSPPQQWPPPAAPPPANSYSYHPNQFPHPPPPPQHHTRPPPPHPPQFQPHSHIPQPYPQEWNNNPGWPQNQVYPEDWAAKARAWADAKTAMENQHSQPHYSPAGRLPEQTHYHDPYQQSVDPRYTDAQNQSHPPSGYQQFSFVDASMQQNSGHSQEAPSVNLEAAYTSDGHSYSARDGTSVGDPTASFEQANVPTNPSVHPQEVPSSYSSVAGKEAADQVQQSYAMLPLPSSSSQEQYHAQPSMHAPSFASHSHSGSSITVADQPLDFAPRFSRDGDLQMQSTYNHHDSGSSMNNWGAPVAPGVGYPPIPPSLPSGPQHNPSITTPGHVAAPYGRFPGPGHPPTIPPNGAPYSLGTVATIHPTAAFSADAYGVSGVPERPKKAPVPNWLREEIKKTVIAAPSADHPKGEQTLVRDGIDKSYVKADDETDSKSIDSSRSAEDEEDEEVEVDRTAAINQEIRKILTDVLLKVTDELFDEIATKVLSEDDLPAEVGHNVDTSNHKASTSPPYAPVAKATAKVLVPVKAKEIENDGAVEKSNSSSPGDVLGLGNYGSDADDEIESSTVPAPAKDDAYMENNIGKTNSSLSRNSNGDAIDQLHDAKMTEESDHSDSSKIVYKDARDNGLDAIERSHTRFNGYSSKDMSGVARSELPGKNGVEKATDDYLGNESRRKSEKNDRHDKSSSEKDFKEAKSSHKSRTDEKGDESKRRKDERNQKKEQTDYISESNERSKEHNVRHGEKSKESESRKRSSHVDVKDDRKGGEKSHRGRTTEDTSRKKEHSKDKGEHKSRRREAGDHDRHKRRRSSSVSSRGRPSKDHSHADDSSGEGSDGSKRKSRSRKRDLSPSPVRSKRRQVSRSPHSKRSQRRHSPYSSLDNSRGRRSRSRSPGRRRR
ncbi:unnamed protein product [Trifolium pratense]|uniref:Uncharacterized protein n=1 Tax=Trifolium pratense TaxID=57577 RepID=A0ACB0IUH0_TRIPR|nr:unnamed protein product [Trifolium pratense]